MTLSVIDIKRFWWLSWLILILDSFDFNVNRLYSEIYKVVINIRIIYRSLNVGIGFSMLDGGFDNFIGFRYCLT